jgi:hypothetical protein
MVQEFVSGLDAKFWTKAFAQMSSTKPARDQQADKLGHQREALEAERQRLLRMTLRGTCSEEDFARESKRIEEEVRDLDRLMPAPVSDTIDPRKTAVHIARTFARLTRDRRT